jgi:hypothetical protein
MPMPPFDRDQIIHWTFHLPRVHLRLSGRAAVNGITHKIRDRNGYRFPEHDLKLIGENLHQSIREMA